MKIITNRPIVYSEDDLSEIAEEFSDGSGKLGGFFKKIGGGVGKLVKRKGKKKRSRRPKKDRSAKRSMRMAKRATRRTRRIGRKAKRKELWEKKKAGWSANRKARIANRKAKRNARELEVSENTQIGSSLESTPITFEDNVPEVTRQADGSGLKIGPAGKETVKAEHIKDVMVDGEKVTIDQTDVGTKQLKTNNSGDLVVEYGEDETLEATKPDGSQATFRKDDVDDGNGWWSGLGKKKKAAVIVSAIFFTCATVGFIMYKKGVFSKKPKSK